MPPLGDIFQCEAPPEIVPIRLLVFPANDAFQVYPPELPVSLRNPQAFEGNSKLGHPARGSAVSRHVPLLIPVLIPVPAFVCNQGIVLSAERIGSKHK